MRPPELPPGYSVERDPDLLILRRPDGTIVAAFSVRGATTEAVEKAAWKDHRSRQGS
jgi:hypothetical protein